MSEVSFNDLRGYLEYVYNIGEVKEINGADWFLEIGAITEVVAEKDGTALLFDEIKGYPKGYRVLSNPFASLQRTAAVLGLPQGLSPLETLDAWRKKVRQYQAVPPQQVNSGVVAENFHTGKDINLWEFPAPQWHEKDGGRYLGTGCAVITRDPDTGWVNIGTYRCQVHDEKTITILLVKGKDSRIMMDKYHERGESCPVAVSFGHDPRIWAAATYKLAWGEGEYGLAGFLAGQPMDIIKGEYTGLPLPATSEIVIEGEIPPPDTLVERPIEGPFGEWAGYYAAVGYAPVVQVKSVYHRDNPIILGAPPLKPPTVSHFALPWRTAAAVWEQLEKLGIPDISGVWQFITNSGGLVLVVAVRQRYEGHAKQAAVAATSCPAGAYGGKYTIVVDDDIDITSPEDVLWAMSTRVDAEKDIDIVRGIWTSPVDPSLEPEVAASGNISNARVIINACRPYGRINSYPPVNIFSKEFKQRIKAKWNL